MEGTQVETIPELIFGIVAELQDLKLADLVAQAWAGHANVAVCFFLNVWLVNGGVIVEEIDDLLTQPLFVMESCIDDQADSAQHIVLQVAKIAVGILEQPAFPAQAVGIECSAFALGRVVLLDRSCAGRRRSRAVLQSGAVSYWKSTMSR